jgi:cysteine-rich repeat protein
VLKKMADVQPGATVEFIGQDAISVYSTAAALVAESMIAQGHDNVDPAAIEDYFISIRTEASVAALAQAILDAASSSDAGDDALDAIDASLFSDGAAALERPAILNAVIAPAQVARTGGTVTVSAEVFSFNAQDAASLRATLSVQGADPIVIQDSSINGNSYTATHAFPESHAQTSMTYALTLTVILNGQETHYTNPALTVTQCGLDCGGEPPAGFCGDGALDSGEECDSGVANTDTACTPSPGQSCSWCDATCHSRTESLDAFCGDGVLNQGEQCDDGAANTNSACSAPYGGSCSWCDTACATHAAQGAFCGDGTVNGSETCDDGNTATEACAYGETSCSVCGPQCAPVSGTTSYCGDGVTDAAGGETCDDGANNGTLGHCNATCNGTIEAVCGNGILEQDEICDQGAQNTDIACSPDYGGSCFTCSTACTVNTVQGGFCGDGILDAASGEACDDNNMSNGDGCSAVCQPEPQACFSDNFNDGDFNGWSYLTGDTSSSFTASGLFLDGQSTGDDYLYYYNHDVLNTPVSLNTDNFTASFKGRLNNFDYHYYYFDSFMTASLALGTSADLSGNSIAINVLGYGDMYMYHDGYIQVTEKNAQGGMTGAWMYIGEAIPEFNPTEWHEYRMEYRSGQITIFVDDIQVGQYTASYFTGAVNFSSLVVGAAPDDYMYVTAGSDYDDIMVTNNNGGCSW